MAHIYHIADASAWELAQSTGSYRHPSLTIEGFIHCSTARQLESTANLYFKDVSEILILTIDEEKVKAPIKYEMSTRNELFPHIYGALNTEGIIAVTRIVADADGKFRIAF